MKTDTLKPSIPGPLLKNCPLCGGPGEFKSCGFFEDPDWTCGCKACGLWLNIESGVKWTTNEGTKNIEHEAKLALALKWNRRSVEWELNDPEK